MIKVLFICHGNICRSTMAESIMTHLVKEAGRNDIAVYSAGTSTEEIGNPVYYATVDKLNEKGIKTVPHKAVQLTKEDYENYDYLIGKLMFNKYNFFISSALNFRNKKEGCYSPSLLYYLLLFTVDSI